MKLLSFSKSIDESGIVFLILSKLKISNEVFNSSFFRKLLSLLVKCHNLAK